MLHFAPIALLLPKLGAQDAPEDLEQDLEAGLGDARVVTALALLVTDEGVLGPRELVEAEGGSRGAQGGADGVAAGVGDVRVAQAEDEGRLAADFGEAVERVVAAAAGGGDGWGGVGAVVGAEGAAVDVGSEIADRRGDAWVELGGG